MEALAFYIGGVGVILLLVIFICSIFFRHRYEGDQTLVFVGLVAILAVVSIVFTIGLLLNFNFDFQAVEPEIL